MPKARELYEYAHREFLSAGIDENEAVSCSRLLFCHVFGTDRNFLFVHGDEEMDDVRRTGIFYELVKKRSEHIPLQHLTNEQAFMGLDFYVDENVLIPRQDTELLVEEAMIEISDGMRVLDLCTGSGCILISLMKYKNEIEGTASDISGAALDIAKKNAERLLDNEKIEFIQSDLFESLPPGIKYDAILSNPPYIRTGDIDGLMPEVRDHDPILALDGHEDGLFFYRKIIKEAKERLMLSGLLMLETGFDQAACVAGLLKEAGYTDIRVLKDYSGNDRVVKARAGICGRVNVEA